MGAEHGLSSVAVDMTAFLAQFIAVVLDPQGPALALCTAS
jgi:hypothetical protein